MRDGKFEFRVLNMTRAKQAGDLSNQFEIIEAQGEFIILTLSVTNIGDWSAAGSASWCLPSRQFG